MEKSGSCILYNVPIARNLLCLQEKTRLLVLIVKRNIKYSIQKGDMNMACRNLTEALLEDVIEIGLPQSHWL